MSSFYGNSYCQSQSCSVPCCNSQRTCLYLSNNIQTNTCFHYYTVVWWVWFIIFIVISILIIIGAFILYGCQKNRQRKMLKALIIKQPQFNTIYDQNIHSKAINDNINKLSYTTASPYKNRNRNPTITIISNGQRIKQQLGLYQNKNTENIVQRIPFGQPYLKQKQQSIN